MTESIGEMEPPTRDGRLFLPNTEAFALDLVGARVQADAKASEGAATSFGTVPDNLAPGDEAIAEVSIMPKEPGPGIRRLPAVETERAMSFARGAAADTLPAEEKSMNEMASVIKEPARIGDPQRSDNDAFRLNRPVPGAPVDERETECVMVFGGLVTADDDIVGLVAYSIYKQHENDWLIAFQDAKGREPNDTEISAFMIGQGTARCLATYRHLAAATLDGRGPRAPTVSSTTAFVQSSYAAAARHVPAERRPARGSEPSKALVCITLAVIFVGGVFLAASRGLIGL